MASTYIQIDSDSEYINKLGRKGPMFKRFMYLIEEYVNTDNPEETTLLTLKNKYKFNDLWWNRCMDIYKKASKIMVYKIDKYDNIISSTNWLEQYRLN